jgi:hypothetical protein
VLAYMADKDVPELLEGICEAGTRASSIVKNMLGFVRVNDDQHKPYDIASLIDKTIELLHRFHLATALLRTKTLLACCSQERHP